HCGDGVVFGWLYMWAGWTFFGATPGKALWRLRVVTEDGGRLRAGRAALRCLGYALASLPVKLGLLPILWDARRQGWHDRIAGTVVLQHAAHGCGRPRLPHRPTLPPPVAPDLRFALGKWWLVAGMHLLMVLVMTWPLALHPTTHRPGHAGDGSHFMWGYWHTAWASAHGAPLTQTEILFHPQTVSLLFHTMNWLNCLLAAPLAPLLNLTLIYNLLLVGQLAASGFCLYLVVCSLTRNRPASFVASLVFGLSPYFLYEHIEHPNLHSAGPLALFALFTYMYLVRPQARYALAAGAALALTGLCSWNYFIMAGITAITLLTAVWLADRRQLGRRLVLLATSAALGAALLSPLLIPMFVERMYSDYMDRPPADMEAYKSSLSEYIEPGAGHPALRYLPGLSPSGHGPGVVLVALALLGIAVSWRRFYPWLLVGLVGLVLSLGPTLSLRGPLAVNKTLLLALGGPPGNEFNVPWNTNDMLVLTRTVLAAAESPLRAQGHITLPYSWMVQWFPFLRPMRCPRRFAVMVMISCAVSAAIGLLWLARLARSRWGAAADLVVPALAGAALLLEYLAVPLPLFDTRAHHFYHQLAAETGDFAVLELPVSTEIHEYQLYQTVHHKRLLFGHLSRIPPDATAFISTNPLTDIMSATAFAFEPAGEARMNIETMPSSRLRAMTDRGVWEAALNELRRTDVRYVILHRQLVSPASRQRTRELLERTLHLPVVVDDEDIVAYLIPSDTDANREVSHGFPAH
ncbi:MAG: RDD family protein, partial [Armatimonadetes bacterium]|nr:RDD family protein [Armatimonadota bacterium]